MQLLSWLLQTAVIMASADKCAGYEQISAIPCKFVTIVAVFADEPEGAGRDSRPHHCRGSIQRAW